MTATLPIEKNNLFLSFSLPPDLQAMLPTENLIEILTLPTPQMVPIAHVPPEVLGVCNWRGEVLWLVDLGALIGVSPYNIHRQPVLSAIIIQHQGFVLGLVVEQINEMLRYDSAAIHPVLTSPGKQSVYLKGCWFEQGKTLWVLDCEALIESFCGNSS
jgi:positive phototaxis protein PixI